MSFSLSNGGFQPKDRIEFVNKSLQTEEYWPGVTPAQAEIVTAAEECVHKLAAVLGLPTDHVSVSISGHANPGHAPKPGWGDEFVSITVNVKAPEQKG